MRRSIKPHLCDEVRSLFNLDPQNKMHFTRTELMDMVGQITNTPFEDIQWDGCHDFMEEELTHLGWQPQETVDTHPNIDNLNFLIRQKKEMVAAQKADQKFKRLKSPKNQKPYLKVVEETQTTNTKLETTTFQKWTTLLNTLNLEPKKMVVYENKIEFIF